MARYIVRRLLLAIPVLIGIVLLVFVLARVIPGNPCVDALGERATPAQVDACRVRFGLAQPIYTQFVNYLGSVSTGNLGNSIKFHIPVTDLIIQRLPTTVELSFYALVFAISVGVPLGIVSAYRRNSKADVGSMMVANLGISTPVFVLGLLLAFIFAIVLKGTWFALPPGGRLSPGVSVKPWTTIETKTVRAAMLKIRSPSAIPRPNTSSEKVIVATPLGPNQPMNNRVGMSVRVRSSAIRTATGRAKSRVKTTIATAAAPSSNSPFTVSTWK